MKIYYNEQGYICELAPYDIPITDTCNYLDVEEETLFQIGCTPGLKIWAVRDGDIVLEDLPISMYSEEDSLGCLVRELEGIINWFTINDWKVNKYVIGEWDANDSRWKMYLAEREEKRRRQDEINNILLTVYNYEYNL